MLYMEHILNWNLSYMSTYVYHMCNIYGTCMTIYVPYMGYICSIICHMCVAYMAHTCNLHLAYMVHICVSPVSHIRLNYLQVYLPLVSPKLLFSYSKFIPPNYQDHPLNLASFHIIIIVRNLPFYQCPIRNRFIT